MIPSQTVFTDDAIGIDPEGCGCTDCLVGSAYPIGGVFMSDIARAVIVDGRSILNRTSSPIVVQYDPVRDDGSIGYEVGDVRSSLIVPADTVVNARQDDDSRVDKLIDLIREETYGSVVLTSRVARKIIQSLR